MTKQALVEMINAYINMANLQNEQNQRVIALCLDNIKALVKQLEEME